MRVTTSQPLEITIYLLALILKMEDLHLARAYSSAR